MIPEYTLIRSKRKSIALQVTHEGNIIVRSPIRVNISLVENFIIDKIEWIKKHQIKIQTKAKKIELSPIEIEREKEKLKKYIIPRIQELYSGKNLPKITSIKITKSEWRWWSCSSKNWLCFSYRLAEYINTPFLDAIIVHELAHLKEKNHQKPFWNLVYSWMPDYEMIMKNR